MLESGMAEVKLRNDQWRKIRDFLYDPRVYVGRERQCRKFVESVFVAAAVRGAVETVTQEVRKLE